MPNATYYQTKYPNMSAEEAAKLQAIDEAATIVLPDTPMSALCRIDEPNCEACQ